MTDYQRTQFINNIAKYVQKYASRYGIMVHSPIIAQAILESGFGASDKVYKDGEWRHNYFGLKWRDKRCAISNDYFEERTAEQKPDGTYINIVSKFMKFNSMEDGVIGYFQWLDNKNYQNLKGVTDPETYLKNIKSDKYATSIDYVQNLMNVINKYNLTKYDKKGDENMSYKVAIDAGHGSQTCGKRTPDGYREHWINVKCANYFDIAMKRCGIETLKVAWNDTNATDDTDVPLATRQAQIKKAKCDISVSFHANAFGNGTSFNSANGIETLISNDSNKVKDSKALATKVHNHLIQGTKQTNRGVKTQQLAMCNCVAMGTNASILIEIGFMTNEYEAGLMKTDAFCLECAEETAQGVCEYLGVAYVKNNTTTSPITLTNSNVSEYIKIGQIHANNFVGSTIPITGKFDANTQIQIAKVLQQAMNLDYKSNLIVDGKFGTMSNKALGTHYTKKGETQYMVSALIILLLLHGYPVPLNSNPATFDATLEAVVKQYQTKVGLLVTGVANANTYKKLLANN